MTREKKNELLNKISMLLEEVVEDEKPANNDIPASCELLTIKECSMLVKGLSEHTIRLLVARKEVASIRTGAGKSGKILVLKTSLLGYLEKIQGQ